jgi:hypothetical protein
MLLSNVPIFWRCRNRTTGVQKRAKHNKTKTRNNPQPTTYNDREEETACKMSPKRKLKRVDSDDFSSGSKTKCRRERLLEGGRRGETVGLAFVDVPAAISRSLVSEVTPKAAQLKVVFKDTTGQEGYAYGSGGLLRGQKIQHSPQRDEASPTRKRRKVKFNEYSSYEVIPVTAKHNVGIENDDDGEGDDDESDEYVRTTIQFTSTLPMEIAMPDGGCSLTDKIVVRSRTADVEELLGDDDDFTFGRKESTIEKTLTKMPFLFGQVPDTFELRKGHKIGIAVFRTYEITHEDAEAPPYVELTKVYGQQHQACIYTGTVTEISANGKTFLHDINTFEGCSGAVVFLLDQNQPSDVTDTLHGLAVGIHSGGVDDRNNYAFKLPTAVAEP